MSSKKIIRSGVLRNNATSSSMSIDNIQQNVIYSQSDVEIITSNIKSLQTINTFYNNRMLMLEEQNNKLTQIIKQLINIDY